ncbi:MAG: hypothetical protein AAGB51_12150 [Planctomycetota bacterium]
MARTLSRRHRLPHFATWAFVAASGALVGTMSGCLERDARADAITEARALLVAIDKDSSGVESAKTYEQVLRVVQQAAQGDDTTAAAAALLVAEAEIGLSGQHLRRSAEHEREVMRLSNLIRGAVTSWSVLDAEAQAASGFDPTDSLAALRADGAALETQLRDATAARDESAAELASLRAEADRNLAEASTHREEAGELILRAAGTSATEAADLVERARELTRQADRLELSAELLEAQIDRGEPVRDALDRDIEAAQDRIDANRTSVADLTSRAQIAQETAAEARREAGALATRITDLFARAVELHRGEAADAANDATSHIERAVSFGGRARREFRERAAGTVGSAHQQHATLLRAKLDALEALSGAARLASEAGALPGSLRSELGPLAQELTAAREEFNQAITDAEDQLIAAGIRERRERRAPPLDEDAGQQDPGSDTAE